VPIALSVRGVTHRYGDVVALDRADLDVERGEVMALLGPSGSGKTTLLAVVAGMLAPAEGRVTLGGRELLGEPPERRRLGMVFQDYALWPHLTVAQNVAFPLRRRGLRGPELRARVRAALDRVGLDGFDARRPAALSGGQQQRVALARAVVAEPELLLLDEPLSALDPDTRGQVRGELAALLHTLGLTTVLVTHDRDDAFELADRVAVLLGGRVAQVAEPATAFERPADAAVARFLGLALFDATVEAGGIARVGAVRIALGATTFTGAATLAVPPARLRVAARNGAESSNALPARVLRRRYVGGAWRLQVLPAGQSRPVPVETPHDLGPDDVELHIDPATLHLLPSPRIFTVVD